MQEPNGSAFLPMSGEEMEFKRDTYIQIAFGWPQWFGRRLFILTGLVREIQIIVWLRLELGLDQLLEKGPVAFFRILARA